jgi:KDO2-lipid IV(A) lauroyltransferase
MKHRPRHLLEYGLLRALGGVLSRIPYRLALALAWCIAALLYGIGRSRVREAERRIREVFGATLDERGVRRAAWRSLRNLCFNVVEIVRLPRLTRAWVERHIDRGNLPDLMARHVAPGQGCILVIPHMGNWDLAGVGAGLTGVPVFVVAARQRNPLTDAFLTRMRAAQGMEVVMRDENVVKRVLRGLKGGRVLAFLTDLRSRTPGMKVQFLGREANVVAGLGLFARQANVPVFAGVVRRVGWTRHVWEFGEPLRADPALDKETDWLRITQLTMDIFERAIRRHPDQYFWYNRRWVLDPLEEDVIRPS